MAKRCDDSVLAGVVQAIRAAAPPTGMTTKIIALDGPGGAGKSTLAARLARALGGAQVVETDDFASWTVPIDWWPRLRAEVLEPLARGQTARFLRSDWEGTGREEWRTVTPAEFVILEGVSASRAAFQPYLTYSIWVETPRDIRLRRGLARDGEAARPQWEAWMEAEDGYIAREKPHLRADCVISGQPLLT